MVDDDFVGPLEASLEADTVEFMGLKLPMPPEGMTYASNPDAGYDGVDYRLVELNTREYPSPLKRDFVQDDNCGIPPICGCDSFY